MLFFLLFQTKAAFTRQYNKSGHKTHYAVDQGPIKKKRGAAASAAAREEMNELGMDVDEAEDSGDDDEDVASSYKVVSSYLIRDLGCTGYNRARHQKCSAYITDFQEVSICEQHYTITPTSG